MVVTFTTVRPMVVTFTTVTIFSTVRTSELDYTVVALINYFGTHSMIDMYLKMYNVMPMAYNTCYAILL